MADTLGSLVDKLSIVDLKLWHCQEKLLLSNDGDTSDRNKYEEKNSSLLIQRQNLIDEIDGWIKNVLQNPDSARLVNPQNKIYGQYRKD